MLLISLSACSNGSEAPDFAYETWRNDPSGCRGERSTLLTEFAGIRHSLIDRDTDFFLENFGTPEIQEPYKRNQIYFRYMVSGASECDSTSADTSFVQIRFNAIGKSNEIIILD